jgi:hypothetical protein
VNCTECPIYSGPQDISVIWQNTERCKEGKFVGKHVSPHLSDGILYSELSVMGVHLYTLWRCCQGDMKVKGRGYVSRKGGSCEGETGTELKSNSERNKCARTETALQNY